MVLCPTPSLPQHRVTLGLFLVVAVLEVFILCRLDGPMDRTRGRRPFLTTYSLFGSLSGVVLCFSAFRVGRTDSYAHSLVVTANWNPNRLDHQIYCGRQSVWLCC